MERQPCKTCPWRRGSDLSEIPPDENGRPAKFDRLAELRTTCGNDEIGGRVMACHRLDKEEICAGWVGAGMADDSLPFRLAVLSGYSPGPAAFEEIDASSLFSGWETMLRHHRGAER